MIEKPPPGWDRNNESPASFRWSKKRPAYPKDATTDNQRKIVSFVFVFSFSFYHPQQGRSRMDRALMKQHLLRDPAYKKNGSSCSYYGFVYWLLRSFSVKFSRQRW